MRCNVRNRTFGHVCQTKIQISLRIRAVWSDSSLGTFWITNEAKFLHVDNEDSDQTLGFQRKCCIQKHWCVPSWSMQHLQYCMCVQSRLILASASAPADQSLCCPHGPFEYQQNALRRLSRPWGRLIWVFAESTSSLVGNVVPQNYVPAPHTHPFSLWSHIVFLRSIHLTVRPFVYPSQNGVRSVPWKPFVMWEHKTI